MPLSDDKRDILTNDLLTWIEQREAEQIAYGVYDVTMTGTDVLGKYQPVDATRPPLADREDDLRTALRWLAEEVLIIRFSAEADPADWVFRSRIAETVRLLSKLRQRLAFDNTAKQRQRISHGKRLTGMELAIAVGLSPKSKGFISEIESGKKCPNVELVLQIAKHFGVSTDYLLRDDIPV